MDLKHIRNFSIIAHIDHGKSTLADRLLELTNTIEKRKMREQVLDKMDLERERGITIKMTPVRMEYHPRRNNADWTQNNAEVANAENMEYHFDRRKVADDTQNNAESFSADFLYKDLTYKIRGALFTVRKNIGLGHKEQVYQNALEIEFKKTGIKFESKKNISILYDKQPIGIYQPDFIIEDKILIELKALPEIGKPQIEQVWSYLKGCDYKIALLVNYGSQDLEIKRIVYDSARKDSFPRSSASSLRESAGVSNQIEKYVLNLIDTPGHIDFSYEVSRALKAVEGSLLLVDATQGVQAQTLTTLGMARELGLTIIPVVTKIDSPLADIKGTIEELSKLLEVEEKEVLTVSGKTGEGVEELLKEIVRRIPPPREEIAESGSFRGLIFDFEYSNHQGIILYVRALEGIVRRGDELKLIGADEKCAALSVGIFNPDKKEKETLSAGEIGYIVTGIKKPGIASVGDTVTSSKKPLPPLSGYQKPRPVVWASIYPESQNDFTALRNALERLKLSDSSLSYEEESSGVLGRGFRAGFLGMLHLEIITERLKREFGLSIIITIPSINYEVEYPNGKTKMIYSPSLFPDYGTYREVREPWVKVKIITPPEYLSFIMQILFDHEGEIGETENWGVKRVAINARMPLRELMRNFFDELKSFSSGFASLSYEFLEMRKAEVVRLDILVAEEVVPAFSRVVSKKRVQDEAEAGVEKLAAILPRQLFVVKIQGRALGRILSSRSLRALKKDVAGYLYGGDITRKMKLREKQKKGKKKMLLRGRVNIPHEVFLKMVRS